MRIDRDSIEEIFSTLTHNKSRSLLTAFGVFWGIFMLVALVGGGNGLKDMMMTNFEGFATNSCFIFPSQTSEAYKGFRKGRRWLMDTDDLVRLRGVEGVDVATSISAHWGVTVYHGDLKYDSSVKGLEPCFAAIESPDLVYGRYLDEIDLRDHRKVCVLGNEVYEALYGRGVDPCGTYVRADGIYYLVIGVINSLSKIELNGRSSQQVIVPSTTFASVYNQGKNIQFAALTVKEGYKVADIKPEIEATLKEAHYISPTDPQAVWMLDADSMFSIVDNVFLGINALIFLVGAGTLLAGIIGVSNIMMVTVKERTTEIGIRRAIGARPADILQQILAESVILTIVAGMAGISAGVGLLSVVEDIASAGAGHAYAFQVSFSGALIMLGTIIALGMVAGLAPAYRAMAIKPVDAMRDE